jgi:hypothetical protein
MAPLGRGGLLAAPDWAEGQYGVLDGRTFSWAPYQFPDGKVPDGRYQVDAAGRIHNVQPSADRKSFTYRMSADGARTWSSVTVALPSSSTMNGLTDFEGIPGLQAWDFRANRAAGVAAVAIQARDPKTGMDRQLVYKFDITRSAPRLSRLLEVGRGDVGTTAGTTGTTVRLDFGSVAIFRDGQVAVSFVDSTTRFRSPVTGGYVPGPGVAIEGATESDR